MRLKSDPSIKLLDKAVKRPFPSPFPRAFGGSLNLQGLIETLGQVVQNSRLADNQSHARRLRGSLQLAGVFAAKGDDRQMFGGCVLLQARQGSAYVVAR